MLHSPGLALGHFCQYGLLEGYEYSVKVHFYAKLTSFLKSLAFGKFPGFMQKTISNGAKVECY